MIINKLDPKTPKITQNLRHAHLITGRFFCLLLVDCLLDESSALSIWRVLLHEREYLLWTHKHVHSVVLSRLISFSFHARSVWKYLKSRTFGYFDIKTCTLCFTNSHTHQVSQLPTSIYTLLLCLLTTSNYHLALLFPRNIYLIIDNMSFRGVRTLKHHQPEF